MAAIYELGRMRRLVNWVVRTGLKFGFGEKNTRLLTVAGRKSGKRMSTPVTLVVQDGSHWIVAPYGERQWVKNLRAARSGTLRRGRRTQRIVVTEESLERAVPVMRAYVERVPVTRKFWNVTPESTDEEYLAEATSHPVFAVAYE